MKHVFLNEIDETLYECNSIYGLKDIIIKNIKLYLVFARNGCVDHYINGKFVQRYSNNPKTGKACLEVGNKFKTI